MIRRSVEEEGQRIAEELGVEYAGPQYNDSELYFHLFTDPLTGGTFAATSKSDAWVRFFLLREEFKAPPPEYAPQEMRDLFLRMKGSLTREMRGLGLMELKLEDQGGESAMANPKTESERKSWHERIFGAGSTPPGERKGLGQTANNMLPMPPDSGPPLPRALGIRWPWSK